MGYTDDLVSIKGNRDFISAQIARNRITDQRESPTMRTKPNVQNENDHCSHSAILVNFLVNSLAWAMRDV